MEMYLLKSAACLGILYAFYKLFLERESMHTLKRFYLLGIILLSFTIPFITFTEYVEATPLANTITFSEDASISITHEKAPNYLGIALGIIYGIGLLFFGLKFGRNLFSMIRKIRKNPRFKNKNVFHVLLLAPTTPHTFLSYIFLNRNNFEANEIPKEVLDHEEVHAREWHSLDVLFIELLLVVFWFNPLLHFIRHSIKLNHEFLADRAVLKTGIDASTYQNTLLAFSSNACSPSLANSINYSFIKKRIKIMRKHTSQTSTWVRSLVVIPLLAVLVYGFSTTKQVEKENTFVAANEISNADAFEAENIRIFVNEEKELLVNERLSSLKELPVTLKEINPHLTKTQRQQTVIAQITADGSLPMGLIFDIKAALEDYGIKKMHIPGKVHKEGTSGTYAENLVLNVSDDAKNPVQKKATAKEVAEYNRLAKKYNDMPKDNMFIIKEEIERMEYLYSKMSKKQRANAQAFPKLPPPPPAPPAPGAKEPKVVPDPPKTNSWVADPDENIPPPPPPPPSGDKNTFKFRKGVPDGEMPPPPPPPPTPESPLDHIKSMAKKDANFYYEGKKISSAKAISLLEKNEDLNIQTIGYNSDRPTVKISTEPIVHAKYKFNHKVSTNVDVKTNHEIKTDYKIQQDPLIDLTQAISEGATFFLNDKQISKDQAIELTKKVDAIATVNVIKGEDGKPEVHFWSKKQ
ncbi:M56 family metallopeptidase [Aureisphaera galaxeae]|uniref:M56 family metallopeptidase n=1 Tax=Aureisphaera galaxeae TaxID=1538023 RepID=UPI0023503669|nr:M56 family metallopeptidase [Aureisphaera galaxeae]MDC8002898.1 M56 family metallopeptidase [Aureisphaera galaxeae]